MKDIERRLAAAADLAQPRRQLSSAFTTHIMERIEHERRRTVFTRLASLVQGVPTMHKLTKPVALGLGLAVIGLMAAGTSYAAIQWLQPHSTLDTHSIVTLPNGNKRFWIHQDSCQGQQKDEPVDSYYEIKAGSKVTPDNLRKGLEAGCEADLLADLFPDVVHAPQFNIPKGEQYVFKPGERQYQSPYVKLDEIGKDYIVTESHLNGRDYGKARLAVDADARFYSKGNTIKLADLKAGDWVTLVSYTTSLDQPFATETTSPDDLEKLLDHGFPIGTRVHGMIKHQYNPDTYLQAMGVMGEDWTRLVKDDKTPDGWRQLIPFDHDWSKYQQQ